MPAFTVLIPADHTGTARSIVVEAATAWLALEKSQKRYGWQTADLLDRGRTIARVDHVPLDSRGLWRVLTIPKSIGLPR